MTRNQQARILDYSDVRTSRKASARFGHSQYAEDARSRSSRRGSSSRSSSSSRSRAAYASHASHASRRSLGTMVSQVQERVRKRKASHQFDRGGYGRAHAAVSGARAAVHAGSLGSRHRRASQAYARGSSYGAAAMSAAGGFFGAITEAIGAFFSRGHRLRFYLLGGFALCLALVCAFLYPSVQNYYIAVRDQAQSQAEYEALQDYYEQLQDDVAMLETDEGIETRAHDKYGWVSSGENSVMVQGVQAKSGLGDSDIGIVPAGSIEAPETWYSGVLDPFFGYKG